MKEYIERAAIEKFIEDGLNNPDKNKAFGHDAIEIMAEVHYMQAADVVEGRHGRWAEYDGADKGFHYCSECKGQAFNYEENGEVIEVLSDYCPNCGARMDG